MIPLDHQCAGILYNQPFDIALIVCSCGAVFQRSTPLDLVDVFAAHVVGELVATERLARRVPHRVVMDAKGVFRVKRRNR